jgi:hypothetical protein
MVVDTSLFRKDFGADIHNKLSMELSLLKLVGVVVEEEGRIKVTKRGMYTVSVMMREFFAALNTLREYCIEKQI